MTKLTIALEAKTDVGVVRKGNEDNFILSRSVKDKDWLMPASSFTVDEVGLPFVVADGMGGAEAGEIASELAVQTIKETLYTLLKKNTNDVEIIQILNEALINAHKAIVSYGSNNAESYGLGTTATICFVKNNKLFISWVGDSRVYRYSKHGRVTNHNYYVKDLEILTDDHSLVWQKVLAGKLTPEQARIAPDSNIITQSLGDMYRNPTPEHRVYTISKDDLIISCSDGLNAMLSDIQIFELIKDQPDIEKLIDNLIDGAKFEGGKDNITVILAKVIDGPAFILEDESSKTKEISAEIKRKRFPIGIVISLLLCLMAVGILEYTGKIDLIKSSNTSSIIEPENQNDSKENSIKPAEKPKPTKKQKPVEASEEKKEIITKPPSSKKVKEKTANQEKSKETGNVIPEPKPTETKDKASNNGNKNQKEIIEEDTNPSSTIEEQEFVPLSKSTKTLADDPEIQRFISFVKNDKMYNSSKELNFVLSNFEEECSQFELNDDVNKARLIETMKSIGKLLEESKKDPE